MKWSLLITLLFILPVRADELKQVVTSATEVLDSVNSTPVTCDEPAVPNSLNEVNSVITENQRGCEPLAPGKHRLMSRQDGYKSGNYLLRNLGGGKFAAVLNIDWKAGPGATTQLVESMKARTMNCLRGLAPYLRNGNEKLELQIISPKDKLENDIPKPREIDITVTPQAADYRGDAGNYGSNFTCKTIGHEMLHMVGLCDEYHEGIKPADEKKNAYYDWSCRPVTSTPSYMRDINVFNEIIPQVRRCDCGSECQRLMNAPEEIKSMFLTNDADQVINNEMSLMGSQITAIENGSEIKRPAFCVAVSDSMKPNERPPVMKSGVYQGETNGNHVFVSYRPRHTQGTAGYNTFYWFGRTTYTCNCTGDTQGYCQRLIQQAIRRLEKPSPRVTCPQDVTSPRDVESDIGPQSYPSGLDSTTNPPQLVLRSPGNGQSLLRPQHFERIKAGNCRGGAASNYEICEEFAYLGRNRASAYKMTLPTNPKENLCKDLPRQCLDDTFYLDGVSTPSTSAQ